MRKIKMIWKLLKLWEMIFGMRSRDHRIGLVTGAELITQVHGWLAIVLNCRCGYNTTMRMCNGC